MRLFDIVCGQKGYELFCGVAKVKDYWHSGKLFDGVVADRIDDRKNESVWGYELCCL